jgi:hypothetical protein
MPAEDTLDDAIDEGWLDAELDDATRLEDAPVDDAVVELDCAESSPEEPPQPANTILTSTTQEKSTRRFATH